MSDKKYLEAESLKEAMWKNFYKEEDKWEGMPEAEFLDVHGGCPRHWFQLGFSAGLDAVVKAEPVPVDGDCVSREAVIDLAMQYCPDDDGSCSRADVDIREMLDELEALPAVPQEMTAREYITIEQRCKSWCVSNCASDGGCESCCYHGSCWADTFDPDAYLRFYALWAIDHPEAREENDDE